MAFLGLTVLAILTGLGLLWFARHNLGGVFLGLAVTFLGLHYLSGLSSVILGVELATAFSWALLSIFLHSGAVVAFAIVYPRIALERRHKIGLVLTAFATLAFCLILLLDPQAIADGDRLTPRFWALQSIPFDLAILLILVLLGSRWLASPVGPRRTQIAWGMIPFLFMALHDGLGYHFYPLAFGPQHGLNWFFSDPFTTASRVVMVLATAGALILAGIAMFRVYRRNPGPDDRALAFVILYALAITLLQVFDPNFGSSVDPPFVHLFVDYLLVFLVIYAVARYNIVDLDLKLKWTLNRGTVAAAFLAVFFAASELSKIFFEGLVGNAVIGVLAASALVFVIAPLQDVAQRLTDRAMPDVQDSSAYRDERRATIYRAQVESLLADGRLSAKERRALLRLQGDLGLDAETSNRIEIEVLDTLGAQA